jgi:hypothetical protein
MTSMPTGASRLGGELITHQQEHSTERYPPHCNLKSRGRKLFMSNLHPFISIGLGAVFNLLLSSTPNPVNFVPEEDTRRAVLSF